MGDSFEHGQPGRLDSWKEIAAYLKRDVTTVQRWERREGLPVHRQLHARQGSVYAFAEELDRWASSRSVSSTPPTPASRRAKRTLMTIAAAILLAVVTVVGLVYLRRPGPLAPDRFTLVDVAIPAPSGTVFGRAFALSPDGRHLAVIVRSGNERSLWVRAVDSSSAVPLPGTADASHPFWSPDGMHIGFFSEGALKTVPAAGGAPRTICAAPGGQDAAWSRNGTILFSRESLGLFAVPATGGSVRQVTTLMPETKETGHLAPHFMPDGRHFLFLADAEEGALHIVWAADLEDGSRERLLDGVISQVFFADGHLLYVTRGGIHARPFDPVRRAFTGAESLAVDRVQDIEGDHNTMFSAAPNGVVAYWPASSRRTRLTWYDAHGRTAGTVGVPGEYQAPSISPDGRRVAVARYDRAANNQDIWIVEHEGEQGLRLTKDRSREDSPVWSPDGGMVAFASNRKGLFGLFATPSDGTGDAEPLPTPGVDVMAMHWSAGGALLFLHREQGAADWDLWIKPAIDRPAAPWRQTRFNEAPATLSPDGRWIAYVSNENGVQAELIVRPVSGKQDARIPGAATGVRDPRWSPDGNSLFYISSDDQMIQMPVHPVTRQPDAANQRILFRIPPVPAHHRVYDVAPDGRFLVNALMTTDTPGTIAVTTRWAARADRN